MPQSGRDQRRFQESGVEAGRPRVWEVGFSLSDSPVVKDFHGAAIETN